MYKPEIKASLSKSILSGLLAGLMVALLSLIYALAYREIANFAGDEIIMPITIIVGLPILLVLGGFAYFLLKKHLPSGTAWFIFFVLAIMAGLLVFTLQGTSKEPGSLFSGLRGLCLGLEVITCLPAAFLIPYFARHPNIYE